MNHGEMNTHTHAHTLAHTHTHQAVWAKLYSKTRLLFDPWPTFMLQKQCPQLYIFPFLNLFHKTQTQRNGGADLLENEEGQAIFNPNLRREF